MTFSVQFPNRTWWHRGKPYSRQELIFDAVIHVVGLLLAGGLGGVLVATTGLRTAPAEWPMICIYVASLLIELSVSLAFNLAPIAPLKQCWPASTRLPSSCLSPALTRHFWRYSTIRRRAH